MTTKRKREDNPEVNSPDALRKLLYSAITRHASAEVALLHIMKEHSNFSPSLLQQILPTGLFILYLIVNLFLRKHLRRQLF